MTNKMKYLIKISLNKKIKTKWFYIANFIFLLLIVGLINIDKIITFFGGDFNEENEILVIDNVNQFDNFKNYFLNYSKYATGYGDTNITLYNNSYDSAIDIINDDNKILLVIDSDDDNYIKAKVVSKEGLGTITNTLINTSLQEVRTNIAINDYGISEEEYASINRKVELESEVLSDKNLDQDMALSTLMQIITLPLFMLIIFLVQMIGAEVNEEKSTKSMEIIISNVSPQTHFISKIISSNLFVIIQGALLIVFAALGIFIRYILSDGNLLGGIESEISSVVDISQLSSLFSNLSGLIPIIIVMLLLTFIAYSLLAGILASMTTNNEDYQQLQTPIVIISLIGYYLSIMAGMFKGSTFIKIMSFVPFISSLLAPTLYVMGDISIYGLISSIILLIGMIYLLIKYGLRIYKVGILNYSGSGLWKKMFEAVKSK